MKMKLSCLPRKMMRSLTAAAAAAALVVALVVAGGVFYCLIVQGLLSNGWRTYPLVAVSCRQYSLPPPSTQG